MLPNLELKPCEHCGRWPNRPLSVDLILIKGKEILLVKRNRELFKGFWALPGGHVEYNESVDATVRREAMEEVGLEVVTHHLINIYSDPKRSPNQGITIAFAVETKGEPHAGDDADEAQYFPLTELPELAFDHKKIINDYLSNNKTYESKS